jgi:aspartate/tyrosine/aromatic aminotransferase
LAEKQHRLFLVLNDPCNNPTGLSLSKDDWKIVIDVLNQVARQDIPVILLHDLAYIDYHSAGFDGARNIFETYLDLDERILTIIAFSGSKTFSLYGFRIGAQIGLSKSASVMEDFCRVGDYSVRARFSSVSRSGMSVIGTIFTNPDKRAAFQNELLEARDILGKRVQLFFETARKCQLTTLPYTGGFFIGVPTENPNIFQDLVKDGVYVITMPGLIRVAISSVPLSDVERLVQIIKKNA